MVPGGSRLRWTGLAKTREKIDDYPEDGTESVFHVIVACVLTQPMTALLTAAGIGFRCRRAAVFIESARSPTINDADFAGSMR
jgi:hypothetical protein